MATLSTVLEEFVQLAEVHWRKTADSLPEVARNSGLFNIVPFPENSGNSRNYSEIDLEEYASRKYEGDTADTALVQIGYEKTMTIQRVGMDIDITVEMRKQGKYPEIIKRLTALGKMVKNRMDLDLTHRLTFATSTSYTNKDGETVDVSTGDDLALLYSAHTLKGSATTYRNRLSGDPQVSVGALEAMEKLAVEETYNQFGEKMTVDFDIIWSTEDPNTCNTIKKILKSTAGVTDPNSGVTNVNMNKYRHVILPRLATDANGAPDSTKAKWWGIASSTDTSAYCGILEEAFMNSPTRDSNAEDVSTEDWTFTTRGSYGICICGARWIKGSCPTT